MKKVVVFGASVVDMLLQSSGLKVIKGHEVPGGVAMCEMLGGKIEAENGVLESGGGGTNVAVGLRRLGCSVKIVSSVGEDMAGKMIENDLLDEGVGVEMLQTGKEVTGMSAVLVAKGGGRSIVTYRGASGKIEPLKVNWDLVKSADWIQISSLGGAMDFLEDIVKFANDRGIGVGINPGKKELQHKERLIDVAKRADYFDINRHEASELTGIPYGDERAIMEKALGFNIRRLTITDGKNGASLIRNGRWVKMGTYGITSVDDTGAGDAFVSGMVFGLLSNVDDLEMLKLGVDEGSSVVRKLGAKEGLIRSGEIKEWKKKKVKILEERL